jgi:ATPase family associated with various cellular activities (AAA)
MNKIEISGTGKPYSLTEDVELYSRQHGVQIFPIGIYFTKKYKQAPCVYGTNKEYTMDAVLFLQKKGQLISDWVYNTVDKVGGASGYVDEADMTWSDDGEPVYRGTFLYKDNFIEIESSNSRSIKPDAQKTYSLRFYHRPGTIPVFKDFEKFVFKPDYKSIIYTIIKTSSGFNFEPFEVSLPDSYDIKTHYEPEFEKIHENILSTLNEKKSGLYLFHGDPGTGKTTYIKYLSSVLKRCVIYVPTSFIDAIVDPSFIPALLDKKHCVIVIEDAEKALLEREAGDSSSLVSTILNLTDGIMGDIFNISIIATYNNPRHMLDKALLRKGRLKKEYHFEKLTVETAQKLIDTFRKDYNVTEPMSLSEIYNIDNENVTSDEVADTKKEKRIGFGS